MQPVDLLKFENCPVNFQILGDEKPICEGKKFSEKQKASSENEMSQYDMNLNVANDP